MNHFTGDDITASNFQINLHDVSLILGSSSLLSLLTALTTWAFTIKTFHLLRAHISHGYIETSSGGHNTLMKTDPVFSCFIPPPRSLYNYSNIYSINLGHGPVIQTENGIPNTVAF